MKKPYPSQPVNSVWMCQVRTTHPHLRQGFSLVQILVAIAILACLALLLTPYVQQSLDRTQRVVCASNLRQIHEAFLLYAQENQNTLPAYRRFEFDPEGGPTIRREFWYTNLNPYLHSQSTSWYCPSERSQLGNSLASSYAMNANIQMHHSLTRIEQPSRFFVAGDANATTRITSGMQTGNETGFWHARNTRANLLFLDGHVETRLNAEIPSSTLVSKSSTEFKSFWLGE